MFEIEDVGRPVAKIRVIGVGGGGTNAVNSMVAANIFGVEFIAVNTDIQHLESSLAPTKIQIGESLTRGLGAGSNPSVGREAALESKDVLAGYIKGADMVFITAGLGGGTGTGAAPVIASIAKELGILTVAIVTKPFFFEGKKRLSNAEQGAHELRQHVNTMIVIPNDRISLVVERGTSLLQSFATVNDVLRQAVQGISDLVLVPGLINLDFADIRAIMQKAGRAVIGMGEGKGEGGAYEAARRAILNPLLEKSSVEGAKGILINITGGLNLSLDQIQDATSLVHDNAHEDAHIILGAVLDPTLDDEIRVTVIATGIDEKSEMVDLPETTVWKPKTETPPLKASATILSKDVDLLTEDIMVASEAQLKTDSYADRALKSVEDDQTFEADVKVSEIEKTKESDISHDIVQIAQLESVDSVSVSEKLETIKFSEPGMLSEANSGAKIELSDQEEKVNSDFCFSVDMSVSAIPIEDKYDAPTFMRRKYNVGKRSL